MRNYYFNQPEGGATAPPPQAATPHKGRGKGRRRPMLRFFCALALVLGLSVTCAILFGPVPDSLMVRAGQSLPDVPGFALPPVEDSEEPTTVERAPLGDGTTLLVASAPEGEELSLQDIYRENIASVVGIRGIQSAGISFGTGVVMSAGGYIITNEHVIAGCSEVEVVLHDDRTYQALLVGADKQTDLAVLKIEGENLRPAQFGDSELLQVGDVTVAIGNPLGEELRGTMTDGIISAINRNVQVEERTMSLIQTTAALNSGNSGGALVNAYGQVVGITNLKMHSYYDTVEGLGFAIPTATAKTVVDSIIALGYVGGRPTIGITAYTLTEELAKERELPIGVYVQEVQEKSDAWRMGMRDGDVITEIDGQAIEKMDDVAVAKASLVAGDGMEVTFYRAGSYQTVRIVLVEQYTLE